MLPLILSMLTACERPSETTIPEPRPIEAIGEDGGLEASVQAVDLREPVLVPASAPPVESPVEQTPRRVYELEGQRLTQLGGERGRQWLLERGRSTFHLEAFEPIAVLADGTVNVGRTPCDLSNADKASKAPYAEVCPGLWRRNPVKGRKSRLEWGADFVRDHLKNGERITQLVKSKVVKDKGRKVAARDGVTSDGQASRIPAVATTEAIALVPSELGIPIEDRPASLTAGRFYAVAGVPGVWLAATNVGLAPPVAGLNTDAEEADADVLLVLFQLEGFDIDFALGTDHPRLDWADRVQPAQRTEDPGPDGFSTDGPLVRTGAVAPDRAQSVISTFTAGFKRSHGAFHRGALSRVNHGSHYGFVVEGVVWSTPQPGLSTFGIHWDGGVELFTWAPTDADRLGEFRHLRQNGSPLVQQGAVGPLVKSLADGNWSGSVEGNSRSMRGGLCLRTSGPESRPELIYGYFTSATPSGMARVFLAAGCDDAMLLDMNALEHTYLAVYTRDEAGLTTHDLDVRMAVLDEHRRDGTVLPRFLALPDNRDFFTVRRRSE